MPGDVQSLRTVAQLVRGQPTSDGAGVKLTRVIGTQALPQIDPFLLLDEFGSDDPSAYIAGFPDHPHRGFETVTYMLEGRMRHRDNKGHEGVLESGSVQWMTAGRGIIHSEMPEQREGRMRGFQLWVNLPARDKMKQPRYQEFGADSFKTATLGSDARAKVIAGRLDAAASPLTGIAVDPLYLDLRLGPGADVELPIPIGHTAVVYVFEGATHVSGTAVDRESLAVLGDGSDVRLRAGASGAAVLMIAGRPIGEPIARYGPFVMNSRDEIAQAFADYQSGAF